LEVHCELCCRDRDAGRALQLERSTHLAMKLRARRGRGALVQHFPKERMSERVRHFGGTSRDLRPGRRQPQVLTREIVADLAYAYEVAAHDVGNDADAKFDAAHR